MAIRVQNKKEMKKTYKSPVVLIVELDADELCQTLVNSPIVEIPIDTDGSADDEDDFAAPTYRTTLWN